MSERTYTLTGMSCDHCVAAVTSEVTAIAGVTGVDIDLATGVVKVISREPVDDAAMRAAVAEAGYDLAS